MNFQIETFVSFCAENWEFSCFFSFLMGNLKGKSGQKISWAETKEHEKCNKMSHHWPQCATWFSRYRILKSGVWARWTSPFCRFLASFSFKYDVTDAILQDDKKWKCNISEVFPSVGLKFAGCYSLTKRFYLISNFVAMATKIKMIVYYWKNKRSIV